MIKENNQKNRRLLTLKEAVQEYGRTECFWRRKTWAREIPFINFGRKIFFDRKDIDAFIERNKTVAI